MIFLKIILAKCESIRYNVSAWVCAHDIINTTHPVIGRLCAIFSGLTEMIGVEDKTKGEN